MVNQVEKLKRKAARLDKENEGLSNMVDQLKESLSQVNDALVWIIFQMTLMAGKE